MIDPATRRNEQWLRALASGLVSRVVVVLATLAQFPISASFLSREDFGLWATFLALFQMLAIADLGIGLGAQNRIAESFGREDKDQVRRIVKTAFAMLAVIAAGLTLLMLAVLHLTPLLDSIPLWVSTEGPDIKIALTIVLCAVTINLPLSLGGRYAIALQESWIVNAWTGIGALLTLLLVATGARLGVGFNAFLLISITGAVLCSLGAFLHILTRRGGLAPYIKAKLDSAEVPKLLRSGGLFLLPQLCATAATAGPPLVLTTVLGPAATAPYVLATRLLNAALQLQQMPIQPLWPALTEALARKDVSWVRRIMVMGGWYSAACAVIGGVAFYLLVDWVVGIWIGPQAPAISVSLAAACATWLAGNCVMGLMATMLNSANHLRSQAIGNTAATIIAFAIMPALLMQFGESGAMWALLVGFGLIGWPYMTLDFSRRWRQWVS